MARRAICPRSARAHRHGAERGETQPNLGWRRRIPRAGTIRAALRQCRWVQRSSECQLTGPPAHKAGKFVGRYMLRPPLAVERLERLASGRLAYGMKTPWRDGTTHVTMSDGELIEKLAALVPAPRFHMVRYFGILASAAKQRPSIVPVSPPASRLESCGHRDTSEKEKPHARNYSWSQLMARIFAVDVLECPRCGGRMRILAAIEDPSLARKILDCLDLPSRPPPVAPARRNRHLELAEL